jgi:uncharacterized membrane protein YgcG
MSDAGKDKGGGHDGPSPIAKAWNYTLLAIIVVTMGLIGLFANQLASLLQVLKMHFGWVLACIAIVALIKGGSAVAKSKSSGGGASGGGTPPAAGGGAGH